MQNLAGMRHVTLGAPSADHGGGSGVREGLQSSASSSSDLCLKNVAWAAVAAGGEGGASKEEEQVGGGGGGWYELNLRL